MAKIINKRIVPTPVGVNRLMDGRAAAEGNCPHTRGGEPALAVKADELMGLSPHPWG